MPRSAENPLVVLARLLVMAALGLGACGGDDAGMTADAGDTGPTTDAGLDTGPPPEFELTVVTFNTGTTEGLAHDRPPDDGYGSEQALISDTYYGDGLAWVPAVEAAARFLAETRPDIVAFQEIFHSDECAAIPAEAHAGFVCETWTAADPTVANVILGAGYQVACNLLKSDKCLAVRRDFGTFRGCDGDLCLDHLDGTRVPDCGGGSRIGRGVVELVGGGSITVVNVHGSSGISVDDIGCRRQQFDQVFVDLGLGDGEPAANGAVNVILGDFNTDPVRLAESDESAARVLEFVSEGASGPLPFHFVSEVGQRVPPTYALFNIDHVISDAFRGSCTAPGVTDGVPKIYDGVYFDHTPIVCRIGGDRP